LNRKSSFIPPSQTFSVIYDPFFLFPFNSVPFVLAFDYLSQKAFSKSHFQNFAHFSPMSFPQYTGLISELEDLCQGRPNEVYDWNLRGKVVQKTNLHNWEENGRSRTYFILIIRDLQGNEIKLTMFQFPPAQWNEILEDHCYEIANPLQSAQQRGPNQRNLGSHFARVGRLQVANTLFNRLPTGCELNFDYDPRFPYEIGHIFRENPTLQVPGSLDYDFLPDLSAYEKEGFNDVRDICAIIRSIERSEFDTGVSYSEFSIHRALQEKHPVDRVFVLILLLCDNSGIEIALILDSDDLRVIARLYPEDFVIRIGDTISVKDVIYHENERCHRSALRLKHCYGSDIIFGDREALEIQGYLPKESEEGLRRKAELAEWWENGGGKRQENSLNGGKSQENACVRYY
jgi:hypothetical protein